MSSGTSVGSTAEAAAGIGSASGGAGAGDGGGSGTGTSIAAGGTGALAGGAGSLVGAAGCAGMASRDTLPGRRESGRPAGMAGAVGSSGQVVGGASGRCRGGATEIGRASCRERV